MPNYSGVWNLTQQLQATAAGNWPSPPIFRAIFAGGITNFNVIDYVDITTTGNAIDFGDMSVASAFNGAVGSTTRGVMSTGQFGNILNTLEFVTFATTGNAADFGDMTSALVGVSGCGSSTRGLFGMGSPTGSSGAEVNTIQYITIASTGNATTFGELTIRRYVGSAMSSPTRAVWAGGNPSGASNRIDYVTIASTGNATTFGTLVQPGDGMSGCGSSTRGIIAGCNNQANVIQYITIASTGNSLDFGDLMENLSQGLGVMSASSEIRAVFGGGTGVNVISYVTIATTGNAAFFGDLTVARRYGVGCSNCGGGVQ
jgi:hypothetical protein